MSRAGDGSLEINREETGSLLLLAEVALIEGDAAAAGGYLAHVLNTNPGSRPAHYYAGFLAWRNGDRARARAHYQTLVGDVSVSEAPEGATNEGDTKSGSAALLAATTRCRGFATQHDDIGSEGSDAMESRYARTAEWLDALARRPRR